MWHGIVLGLFIGATLGWFFRGLFLNSDTGDDSGRYSEWGIRKGGHNPPPGPDFVRPDPPAPFRPARSMQAYRFIGGPMDGKIHDVEDGIDQMTFPHLDPDAEAYLYGQEEPKGMLDIVKYALYRRSRTTLGEEAFIFEQ
jgi:hypothetical protein